ncbi:YacL family protein [Oceanisphaera pacifica]|uniref:YacL family protein n=1 Tax=Oceanisphaera pacifica TaxID=2818389 RepID=A0ABS3NC81_9GAMM|nr:YacL family protein [Oceanisphaera pacifica]
MEFEFFRDLNGHHRARFSMGHEAMGQWLTDEVNVAETTELLTVIAKLTAGELQEFKKNYAECSLLLTQDEAELSAHSLNFESELEDGMAYYDDELYAGCGLDDLARVLEQWQDFCTNQ